MLKKSIQKNNFNLNANKIPCPIPGMKANGIHLIKASFEIDAYIRYTQVIKKVYSITCISKFLRLLLSKTMVSNNQTNVSEMLLKIPTCGRAVDGLADVEFAEFLNSMWDGLL